MTKTQSFFNQLKYALLVLFMIALMFWGRSREGGIAIVGAVSISFYLGWRLGKTESHQNAMDAGIIAGYDMGRALSKTSIKTLGKKNNP